MEKKALDISSNAANAYRLLNPGLVMLVSVGDGSRDNLFSVTWNMPIRKTPGMVAILAGKRHYSYSFIEETGEFGINVPDASMADAVFGCGTTSGADGKDKFVRFGLTREESQKIKAPVVKEAIAHLECRVCQVVDMGASSLLIAQILAAAADPRYFKNGEWKFDDGLQLLHHLGDDHFSISERAITAKKI
ncbi:MAG: flavin reductase family protein [bacterium]|nr:flavin reductase family protein [bacterium]